MKHVETLIIGGWANKVSGGGYVSQKLPPKMWTEREKEKLFKRLQSIEESITSLEHGLKNSKQELASSMKKMGLMKGVIDSRFLSLQKRQEKESHELRENLNRTLDEVRSVLDSSLSSQRQTLEEFDSKVSGLVKSGNENLALRFAKLERENLIRDEILKSMIPTDALAQLLDKLGKKNEA
jgi:hypothetical protein